MTGPKIEGNPLIIEGYTHLAPDQNFYDQPPFAETIRIATERTIFSLHQMRRGLTFAVSKLHTQESSLPQEGGLNRNLFRDQVQKGFQRKSPVFNNTTIDAETFRHLKNAFAVGILDLVGSLDPYPLWSQYVHVKRQNGGFNDEGKRTLTRPRIEIPEPTYVQWLTEQ